MPSALIDITQPAQTIKEWEALLPTSLKTLSSINSSSLSKLFDLKNLQIAAENYSSLNAEDLIDAPSFFIKDFSSILAAIIKSLIYNKNFLSHKIFTAKNFLETEKNEIFSVKNQIQKNEILLKNYENFLEIFVEKSLKFLRENEEIAARSLSLAILKQIYREDFIEKSRIVDSLLPKIGAVKSHFDEIIEILIFCSENSLEKIEKEIEKIGAQNFDVREANSAAILKFVIFKLKKIEIEKIIEKNDEIYEKISEKIISNEIVASEIFLAKISSEIKSEILAKRSQKILKLAKLADSFSNSYKFLLDENDLIFEGVSEILPENHEKDESINSLALWHCVVSMVKSVINSTQKEQLLPTIYDLYSTLLLHCFHPMLVDLSNKTIYSALFAAKLEISEEFAFEKIGAEKIYPGRRSLPLTSFFKTFLLLNGKIEKNVEKLIFLEKKTEKFLIHFLNILKMIVDSFFLPVKKIVEIFKIFSKSSNSPIFTISSISQLGMVTSSNKLLQRFSAEKVRWIDLPFLYFCVTELYEEVLSLNYSSISSEILIILTQIYSFLYSTKSSRNSIYTPYLINHLVKLAYLSPFWMIRSISAAILSLILREDQQIELMHHHSSLNHRHFCYELAAQSKYEKVKEEALKIEQNSPFNLLDERLKTLK